MVAIPPFIVRLIRAHKFIDQEKIQRIAMIPAKEVKQLTYTLLHENYLQIQELRKSMATTAGPNKIFFLFHINLEEVSWLVPKAVLDTVPPFHSLFIYIDIDIHG